MNQTALWHDTIHDALAADVMSAGGFKTVAAKLWPTLGIDSAATKLRNALNPEQNQKLCPEEVMTIKKIAKEVGSSATINYEARELSFSVQWIEPEDELTKLLREYLNTQSTQTSRKDRIDALIPKTAALKAVR